MLIDRLFLAKQMMSKDAGLFVHIDEREQHRLKQLIIQVLGEENYLAPFVWIARTGMLLRKDEFKWLTKLWNLDANQFLISKCS